MMIHCGNCRFRNDQGFCTHEKIREDWGQFSEEDKEDALIYSYSEGGGFWVGPKFGCVHGEKINQSPKIESTPGTGKAEDEPFDQYLIQDE